MRHEVERAYAKLAMQFDDKPGSEGNEHRLPQMYLFRDLPVFKHRKKSIRDASINGGWHINGIALTPQKSKFRVPLDVYFIDKQSIYRTDKLDRIEVDPIIHDIERAVDYSGKTFKQGKAPYDATIILPKSVSELPGKGPWRFSPFRATEPTPAIESNRAKINNGRAAPKSSGAQSQVCGFRQAGHRAGSLFAVFGVLVLDGKGRLAGANIVLACPRSLLSRRKHVFRCPRSMQWPVRQRFPMYTQRPGCRYGARHGSVLAERAPYRFGRPRSSCSRL